MDNALGLVMVGGGARGAYQAGVLKRIGEIKQVQSRGNPFPIIAASSAGAINAAAIASGSDDFEVAADTLAHLWSELRPSDVFRCDVLSQTSNSLTWILDLSFGGIFGGGNARSLLDATPLRHYLNANLHCDLIDANIKNGHFYALAISATNYNSGKGYLFIQGRDGHPMWQKSRRVTQATKITVGHICASAAIPMIFQPVKLQTTDGTAYFGDGCIRLQQPLSPVIRLGAERILAIDVRGPTLERQNQVARRTEPSIAEVMGVLFDVMFLDHLATDIEHLERLNQLLCTGQITQSDTDGCERMRPLRSLLMAPSVDLADLADRHKGEMPSLIHYFIRSLGRDPASWSDLMSYLLFAPGYTSALIDIGYHDADNRIDEIETFLYSC